MAAEVLRCPSCGSVEIENISNSVGKCQHCGSTMLLPKQNAEIVALLNNAYVYRSNFNYDLAIKTYQFVLEKDSSELAAYEGLLLSEYGIEYVKDTYTGNLIPTCHRAHFTSIYNNEYYKTLMSLVSDEQKSIVDVKVKEIDKLQKAIERQLKNEQEYDVFISYKATDVNGDKTEDAVLAREIYDELSAKNYRVFFAEKSLEDRVGSEYEPIIFKALHTSKIFILVGCSKENVEANWVRNEWSRFIDRIKNEDGLTKNSFIPVFKDMNPYDMPKVNNAYVQGVDAGKLGYLTTLTDGVLRLLKPEKEQKVLETFENLDAYAQFTKIQKQKQKELKDRNWKNFTKSKGVKKWLYYTLLAMPVLIAALYWVLCLTTESYFKKGTTFTLFHIVFTLLIAISIVALCVHAKRFKVKPLINVIIPFGSLALGLVAYLLMYFYYPVTITGLSAQQVGAASTLRAEGYFYTVYSSVQYNNQVRYLAQIDHFDANKDYESRIKTQNGKRVYYLPDKINGVLVTDFQADIPQDIDIIVLPKREGAVNQDLSIKINMDSYKNIEAIYCYSLGGIIFDFVGAEVNYHYDEGLPFTIYHQDGSYSEKPSHFVSANAGYYE